MITNQEVLENGKITDHYLCDIDWMTNKVKSNGGVDNTIEYKGSTYSVISDIDQKQAMNPNKIAEYGKI